MLFRKSQSFEKIRRHLSLDLPRFSCCTLKDATKMSFEAGPNQIRSNYADPKPTARNKNYSPPLTSISIDRLDSFLSETKTELGSFAKFTRKLAEFLSAEYHITLTHSFIP